MNILIEYILNLYDKVWSPAVTSDGVLLIILDALRRHTLSWTEQTNYLIFLLIEHKLKQK